MGLYDTEDTHLEETKVLGSSAKPKEEKLLTEPVRASELEPIGKIMDEAFADIQVIERLNANRTYFYPHNKAAVLLCSILKQKTLTQDDVTRIKEFFDLCSISFKISVVSDTREL